MRKINVVNLGSRPYNSSMARTIGYMITWTTYGTWLQGDKRGFVKEGQIYPPNKRLSQSNKEGLTKRRVKLSQAQRQVVQIAIHRKAAQLNQKILALYVCSNHVHIVADYIPKPIGRVVSHYKNAAQAALRRTGITGRVWTKGFDKRYCFDQETLTIRIDYVRAHDDNAKYS